MFERNNVGDEDPLIALMGASITEGWANMRTIGEWYYNAYGYTPLFCNRAKGGDKIADTQAKVADVLLEQDWYGGVFVHSGGNDVSNHGPYADDTQERKDAMTTNLISIIAAIQATGAKAYVSDLGKRNYSIGGNPLNDTDLYNEHIFNPIRKSLTTHSHFINSYNFIDANQDLISVDGVHPNGADEDAIFGIQYARWFADIAGATPVEAQKTISVDFGNPGNETSDAGWSNLTSTSLGSTASLVFSDDSPSKLSVSVIAPFTGNSTGGAPSPGNFPSTAEADYFHKDDQIVNDKKYAHVRFYGFGPRASFTADVASSRTVGSTRETVMSIQGNSRKFVSTNKMDTEQWTEDIDNDGSIDLTIETAVGTGYSYLNAITVTVDAVVIPPTYEDEEDEEVVYTGDTCLIQLRLDDAVTWKADDIIGIYPDGEFDCTNPHFFMIRVPFHCDDMRRIFIDDEFKHSQRKRAARFIRNSLKQSIQDDVTSRIALASTSIATGLPMPGNGIFNVSEEDGASLVFRSLKNSLDHTLGDIINDESLVQEDSE